VWESFGSYVFYTWASTLTRTTFPTDGDTPWNTLIPTHPETTCYQNHNRVESLSCWLRQSWRSLSHQTTSLSSYTGPIQCQPKHCKIRNHVSRLNTQKRSRWSIASGFWSQSAQGPWLSRLCLCSLSDVQHPSWRTNHMKNLFHCHRHSRYWEKQGRASVPALVSGGQSSISMCDPSTLAN
jgi:hypothetical protein